MGESEKVIHIYTDGACSGNPGKGGWAFVIVEKNLNGMNELFRESGGERETTNNRMEMYAVLSGLKKIAAEIKAETLKVSSISVYTDSSYVKKGITEWIFSWKKNGWKTSDKKPVKNKDLWEAIDLFSASINPEWFWVKGHAGNTFNEICDKLATAAAQKIK